MAIDTNVRSNCLCDGWSWSWRAPAVSKVRQTLGIVLTEHELELLCSFHHFDLLHFVSELYFDW